MHTCLIKNIAATKCQITYKVKYLHIKGWQTDKKSIVFINVMTIVEFHVETGEIRQIFASKLTSPKDVLISARPFDGEDCQKVVIFSLRCLKSTLFSWYFLINIEYWTRQISLSVFIANMCPIFDGPQSINLTRYKKSFVHLDVKIYWISPAFLWNSITLITLVFMPPFCVQKISFHNT